jgi:hypothetical protein
MRGEPDTIGKTGDGLDRDVLQLPILGAGHRVPPQHLLEFEQLMFALRLARRPAMDGEATAVPSRTLAFRPGIDRKSPSRAGRPVRAGTSAAYPIAVCIRPPARFNPKAARILATSLAMCAGRGIVAFTYGESTTRCLGSPRQMNSLSATYF